MKRILVIGAIATLGATVLTGAATASAAPAPKAPAAPAVTWGACPTGYPAAIQCGKVRVPLDYARPNGAKIDIAVSRAKATGSAAERQGVLLVNRGGPGGTGVAYAASIQNRLPAAAKKAYDVIGFDPRGVGLSNPLYCVDPKTFYQAPIIDPVPTSDRDLAANTARAAKYAKGCLTKNGAAIRHYNTPNTARDMDVIRAAVGEKQINYLGYSYGTYLGAVYATLFPKNSRRFILDSNVDPTGIWYANNLSQNVAFEVAFSEFKRWVAGNDATYHLGTTAAAVDKAWYGARAALKKKPAGGFFGATEFESLGTGSMYGDSTWPGLAKAVSDYVTKKDDSTLLATYGPTDLAGENGNTMYTTVECNDKVWPHNLRKWYADASRQYKQGYRMETWANTWLNMPCAFWPYSAAKATKIGGKNLPKILMFNATGDAATPYAGSLNMHKALAGSRLVTVKNQFNHGQYLYESKNACTMGHGTDYLVTGKLPATDVSCEGNPHPSPTVAKSRSFAPSVGGDDRPGRR